MNTDSSTEVRQAAELMALHARIEALEAALEKILRHPAGLYEEQAEIASAALDKDRKGDFEDTGK